MKATELMIGDWYYDTDLHKNRKFHQLQFAEAYGEPTYELKIEPIPLTPEILEKNGFKFVRMSKIAVSSTKLLAIDTSIKFQFLNKECFFIVEHSGAGTYEFKMYIKYVHTLQHALRLCGLDELADNFQI